MKTSLLLCLLVAASLVRAQAASLGSAFTYQGRLTEAGQPANGEYDLRFLLFDADVGGIQNGPALTNENLSVTGGVFTATLDFGTNVFTGRALWLEIAVRPGTNTGAFTDLTPRQPVTATPYALGAVSLLGPLADGKLAGTYGGVVNISNAANQFGGAFSGNGGGLTNLNAARLMGTVPAAALSNAWRVGGNAGTVVANHFLGTTDNQPFEIRVNGSRALRLQPDTSPANAPSVIGGSSVNMVAPGVVGATIAGGGSADYEGNGPTPNTVASSYGTVGGGVGNDTAGVGATIGGGYNNTSIGFFTTVAGGGVNLANGDYAFVGGGLFNQATNTASTVAGGRNNRATGRYSSVGGGSNVQATGSFSTVAGGLGNMSSSSAATVGGGNGNQSSGGFSTVAGGVGNLSSGYATTIGGGSGNFSSSNSATVGGGQNNQSSDNFATVGGGINNQSSEYAATVGGGYGNTASATSATVGGGVLNTSSGASATVGGGLDNTSSGSEATISGGRQNQATNTASFVGGGRTNRAYGLYSTIAGGTDGLASGDYSTVAGGRGNTSSGRNATVPGGFGNEAAGHSSFAAGYGARALHDFTFVWGDGTQAEFTSSAGQQFLICAFNGVGINHNAPDAPLHVVGGTDVNLASGGTLILGTVSGLNLAIDGNEIQARNNSAASPLFLNAGGGNVSIGTTTANARLRVLNATCDGTTWNNASDRNLKAGFEPVDARRVLEQVAALPLTSWHYTNAPGTRHLGPMAQDFQAAFGLGADDKSITTVDADGVALVAIQGLNALLKAQAAELKALKQELAELRRAVKAGQ